MSYKAILNVNLLAARVGANELEFCFKKINSYKSFEQKSRFVENVAKAVEEILIEEIKNIILMIIFQQPIMEMKLITLKLLGI